MQRMVRKQIYIHKRQQLMLKRLARAQRLSEAEIIRQALDRTLAGVPARNFHPDPEAGERALAFMRALHARGPLPGQRRTWKREDAYEERLSRYERRHG